MRTLVLVDGEHYPPVVRAAIERLPFRIPGCQVVGAAFLGGLEKLTPGEAAACPDLGVPVVGGCAARNGTTPEEILVQALDRFTPELVVDLSDQPVVDARRRMGLAAIALHRGAVYQGPDFRFDPPPRPRLTAKPSIAVIGTGKRTGKTSVCAAYARVLKDHGTPPVIVTMGRGGPPEPELVDPACTDLSPRALVALAKDGRHAASDHFEDAVIAGVATVGTRRCGGGLVGAPGDDTFVAGVVLADRRAEPILLYEGSGPAIPPVHADATVLVVPAHAAADPELLTGYLGRYRLLLADLIVITMASTSLAVSGAGSALEAVESSVRGLAPGAAVVATEFRPMPLEPISGRRIFYATTASPPVAASLAQHLEAEHDCRVVGFSSNLADRRRLAADLQQGLEEADVLVVELKAAAVDLAAGVALERGREVVFCDNRIVSLGGVRGFEEAVVSTTELAIRRSEA